MARLTQHSGVVDPSGNGSGMLASTDTQSEAPQSGRWQFQARLQHAIETELLPRLMLANRASSHAFLDKAGPQVRPPDDSDVCTLADLLLVDDEGACESFVESFRDRQVSLDQVLLELLAPAARQLGDRWNADECDFTQVTVGLCRIQAIVFELHQVPPVLSVEADMSGRRALLCSMPNSDHTLGVLMLAEFFRRANWDVWNDTCHHVAELEAVVSKDWFDLIGLSASTDAQAQSMQAVIASLRQASRNPGVVVMAGGPVFQCRPELVEQVGADLTALDARDAVEQASKAVVARMTLGLARS